MKKQATKKADTPNGINQIEDECLTALPPRIDIAALAALYNAPKTASVAHEYLLEEARQALAKYELAQADLEIAADSLARSMHMLVEQHGLKKLPLERMAELERHVLDWYGLCPLLPSTILAKSPAAADKKRTSKIARHKQNTLVIQPATHTAHGTASPH